MLVGNEGSNVRNCESQRHRNGWDCMQGMECLQIQGISKNESSHSPVQLYYKRKFRKFSPLNILEVENIYCRRGSKLLSGNNSKLGSTFCIVTKYGLSA